MARPADLVDNMWKMTTVVPQRMVQIRNNGRITSAERQLSKTNWLRINVYLMLKKRPRADQRSSVPIGASLDPFPIQIVPKLRAVCRESETRRFLYTQRHSPVSYAGIGGGPIGIHKTISYCFLSGQSLQCHRDLGSLSAGFRTSRNQLQNIPRQLCELRIPT